MQCPREIFFWRRCSLRVVWQRWAKLGSLILKTLLSAEWNPCLALGLDWAHLCLKGAILYRDMYRTWTNLAWWPGIGILRPGIDSYTLPSIGFASLDQRPLNWAFDVAILESERNSFHYHFQTSKSSDCVQLGDISSWHDTFHVTFQCVTDWWAKSQKVMWFCKNEIVA